MLEPIVLSYRQVRLLACLAALRSLARRWALYVAFGLAALGAFSSGAASSVAGLVSLSVLPLVKAAQSGSSGVLLAATVLHGLVGALILWSLRELLLPRAWADPERALPLPPRARQRADAVVALLALLPLAVLYGCAAAIWWTQAVGEGRAVEQAVQQAVGRGVDLGVDLGLSRALLMVPLSLFFSLVGGVLLVAQARAVGMQFPSRFGARSVAPAVGPRAGVNAAPTAADAGVGAPAGAGAGAGANADTDAYSDAVTASGPNADPETTPAEPWAGMGSPSVPQRIGLTRAGLSSAMRRGPAARTGRWWWLACGAAVLPSLLMLWRPTWGTPLLMLSVLCWQLCSTRLATLAVLELEPLHAAAAALPIAAGTWQLRREVMCLLPVVAGVVAATLCLALRSHPAPGGAPLPWRPVLWCITVMVVALGNAALNHFAKLQPQDRSVYWLFILVLQLALASEVLV